MIFLYHTLATVLLLLVLPVLPFIWLASSKRRANLFQRLGLFTGIPLKKTGESRIWVHALSVGEVNSAVPFVAKLKEKRPGAKIVFTASTRTGFEMARRLLSPEKKDSPVSILGYFPFDVWICVLAVAFRIRPDSICLVETDLWPGFLFIMKKLGVPVVLVNARLSKRSLDGYRRLGPFSALFFSGLSRIMAQTPKDREGFESLGFPKDRISVTGNMKFDRPGREITGEACQVLEKKLGVLAGQKVWIAGSTHQGEESMVVDAFFRARAVCPELKLVIAPRNPDRTRQLRRDPALDAYITACFSDGLSEKIRADILFIDTMGELSDAYAACDLAFIGGSLVKQGGHNPLEPAVFGKPIVFGPHMSDFREIEALLLEARGAVRVGSGEELAEAVVMLLTDSGHRERTGQAARDVFYGNSGALERIFKTLEGGLLV